MTTIAGLNTNLADNGGEVPAGARSLRVHDVIAAPSAPFSVIIGSKQPVELTGETVSVSEVHGVVWTLSSPTSSRHLDGETVYFVASAGGGGVGNVVVRKFPFAHDTAGLLTGATVYTPTVGDVLLNAWVEILEAWDGTTPMGDYGMFVGTHQGWNGFGGTGAIDMTQSNFASLGSGTSCINSRGAELYASTSQTGANAWGAVGEIPLKFTAANPIKVCVSQNGSNNGLDPVSSHGSAVLYLVTATPA